MNAEFQTPDTIQYLMDWLEERECASTLFFREPSFLSAIVGITDEGQLCYHYDLMVESLIKSKELTFEEASDIINYDTIRSLEMPKTQDGIKPLIIYPLNGV